MTQSSSPAASDTVFGSTPNGNVSMTATLKGIEILVEFELGEKLNSIALKGRKLVTAVGIPGYQATATKKLSKKIAREAALIVLGIEDKRLQENFLPLLECILESSLTGDRWNYRKEHKYG